MFLSLHAISFLINIILYSYYRYHISRRLYINLNVLEKRLGTKKRVQLIILHVWNNNSIDPSQMSRPCTLQRVSERTLERIECGARRG